jgi:hypothetical protein
MSGPADNMDQPPRGANAQMNPDFAVADMIDEEHQRSSA